MASGSEVQRFFLPFLLDGEDADARSSLPSELRLFSTPQQPSRPQLCPLPSRPQVRVQDAAKRSREAAVFPHLGPRPNGEVGSAERENPLTSLALSVENDTATEARFSLDPLTTKGFKSRIGGDCGSGGADSPAPVPFCNAGGVAAARARGRQCPRSALVPIWQSERESLGPARRCWHQRECASLWCRRVMCRWWLHSGGGDTRRSAAGAALRTGHSVALDHLRINNYYNYKLKLS